MPPTSASPGAAQRWRAALRLPRRHRAALEATTLLLAAAGIGTLVWYASTSRGGRSELASTSQLASGVRAATGANSSATSLPARNCSRPRFSTAAPFGIWSKGAFNVYNNMWNEPKPPASGRGTQKLYVCNYNSWYVVADMPAPGEPADSVKTYPNVQENFNSVPIASFSNLTSTFRASGPRVGDFEFAYDTWLNGLATKNSNEVMVWTYNHGQTPGGSPDASARIGGVGYTVWRTASNSYIAFVPSSPLASGRLNLLAFYDWLTAKDWLPQHSVLDQVDFGVEICSTAGTPAKFSFTNFSLDARYGHQSS